MNQPETYEIEVECDIAHRFVEYLENSSGIEDMTLGIEEGEIPDNIVSKIREATDAAETIYMSNVSFDLMCEVCIPILQLQQNTLCVTSESKSIVDEDRNRYNGV